VKPDKSWLEALYHKYNHPKWIHPDPLEFVHLYKSPLDQEIVGLIASSLAYGRVRQILASAESVLRPMGSSPRDFLLHSTERTWTKLFQNFRHRFTTAKELISLLKAIKGIIMRYGSLYESFLKGLSAEHDNVIPALSRFVQELISFDGRPSSLLPPPEKGSACKRLHLFLRWMVRKDRVDPGPWEQVSPRILVIPLDTHMFQQCSRMGMTRRKNANLTCALEITRHFQKICPEDPVKYDFALSRLGIRKETFDSR